MNLRRKIAVTALVILLLPVLAVALLLMLTSPERYRDRLAAEVVGQTGATLSLAEPLAWQLWPAGIRFGGITLSDTGGQPLLQAKSATAELGLADLLRGRSGIRGLLLEEAQVNLNVAADGRSNWDPVLARLAKADTHSLSDFQARKTRIVWHREGVEQDITLDAGRISLGHIDQSRGMPLDSDFLISRLDAEGGNLLLQNTLKGRLEKTDDGWRLRDSRFTSIVSSTYVPGQASVDMQGDLLLVGGQLQAPDFKAVLLYKNMTMPQPDQAMLSGRLVLDGRAGQASFGDLVFKSAGNSAARLQAREMAGNWKTGALSADGLTFSLLMEGRQVALPEEKPLSARAMLHQAESGWQLDDIALQIGQSQLAGQVRLALAEAGPAWQLRLDGQGMDASDIALLLNREGLRGTLDFKADLEGTGDSWESFLANGKGTVTLHLKDGRLEKTSIPGALWERLENYRSLLPELAASSPVEDKTGTPFKTLSLDNRLKDGIVTTRSIQADMGLLSFKGSGQYDAHDTSLSYDGQLRLDKAFFVDARKPYDMPVECRATLREEHLTFAEALETGCGMSQAARRDTLTQALKRRFLETP